jgi:predicted DNA-binding protein
LLSEKTEQKESIQKLATTLEELSLQNAKLFYINEVLKADSLNERQRQIAVEALQEVKSVEHAKTVFDTLQSAVVSTKRQGRPESLSEVVSNNTSMRMPRRKEQKLDNPQESRWKQLAGIK